MNRRRIRSRHSHPGQGRVAAFALGLVLIAGSACTGCSSDRRSGPTVARDLTTTSSRQPFNVPLAPRVLATQQDFDRFEAELLPLSLGSRQQLARLQLVDNVYSALAEGAEPGKHAADAILLQRLALVRYRVGREGDRFPSMLKVVDQLRPAAPESPHTLFMLGEIRRLMLPSRSDGSFLMSETSLPWGKGLSEEWHKLLAVAPDYQGPSGRNAEALRRVLQRLDAAIAQFEASAAKPASPTVDGAGSGIAVAPGVAAAREDLWRFEAADEGQRIGVCRDRAKRGIAPGDSALEISADIVCSITLGSVEDALKLLRRVIGSPAVPMCDRVAWLARVATAPLNTYAAATELAAGLKAAGKPVCKFLE